MAFAIQIPNSVPDLAGILPYDADNLRKVLNRTAKPSARMLDRLEQAMGQDSGG